MLVIFHRIEVLNWSTIAELSKPRKGGILISQTRKSLMVSSSLLLDEFIYRKLGRGMKSDYDSWLRQTREFQCPARSITSCWVHLPKTQISWHKGDAPRLEGQNRWMIWPDRCLTCVSPNLVFVVILRLCVGYDLRKWSLRWHAPCKQSFAKSNALSASMTGNYFVALSFGNLMRVTNNKQAGKNPLKGVFVASNYSWPAQGWSKS